MVERAGEDQPKEFYPSPDSWMEEGGRVHLIGSRCPKCGKYAFPSKTFCDQCGDPDGMQPAGLSDHGVLYSFTEVHVAPKVFATPYVVGYVDLPEGVRVFGQVEHPVTELQVDEPVRIVLGIIRTGENGQLVISYKFRKKGETGHA